MAYLSQEALQSLGFKRLGRNVRISERAALYNHDLMEIGDHSRIDDFCVVSGKITMGRNVHIAASCTLAGGTEGAIFDDFCGVSYGSHVFTQSDDYSGRFLTGPTVPSEFTQVARQAVRIGRHCIVGAGSLVLPGVHLAEGCSVGAMSLVTRSTEPWGIYVGAPAKRLKDRHRDLLELEKRYLQQVSASTPSGS
jgi:galactoside O-acetyltransferase